jgi:LPXTG-motif cell wall-anchored protein
MVVNVFYNNGTNEDITTGFTVPTTALTTGQTSVEVSFGGKSTTQAITVSAKALQSIEITTAPTNTTFKEGTTFTTDGVITLTYDNGTTSIMNITTAMCSPVDMDQIGDQTVTITYGAKTTSYDITIEEKSVSSIEITTYPTVTFVEGEVLSLAGGKIEITYDNGTTELLDLTNADVVVTGYNKDIVGKQTLTVTYKAKTTTYDVTVKTVAVAKEKIKADFTDKIPALATIKLSDAAAIKALKAEYDALSPAMKALVPTETVAALTAALAKVAELEKPAVVVPTPTTTSKTVKTGDTTSISFLYVMLVLSAGAIVFLNKRKAIK